MPKFEWVDPRELFIEDSYQRSMSGNSTRLVRNIVAKFSWVCFKAPICVRLVEWDNVLVCIDGQHTATAAASHPKIDKIPVMVVSAADVQLRAGAFVGHNRDRLNLTQMAIFRAEVAAGTDDAVQIEEVCKKVGVTVPKYTISLKSDVPVGTCMAIGTMRMLLKRQRRDALANVLKLLVAAKRGPVMADEIGAVALVLAAAPDSYDRLLECVKSKDAKAWRGIAIANSGDESIASSLAAVWCRELDLHLGGTGHKRDGKNSTMRVLKTGQELKPLRASPAGRPVREAPPPAPKHIATPKADAPPIERNGIKLEGNRLFFKGKMVNLMPDEALLIGCLLKVMPAILPDNRLLHNLDLDGISGDMLLQDYSKSANMTLREMRLEVKRIPKFGYALADLDAAAA